MKRYIAVSLLSAGWLFPLFLSWVLFLEYLRYDLAPEVIGHGFKGSFSALGSCVFSLLISFAWLGTAIVFWALHFLKARQSA
jgi:hypothetical protein